MIPLKNLIELNTEHKSPIHEISPLNDGAFVVRYDNYDCKVCNYLGNGFMISSAEYPFAHDFKLEDGLLYFNFIERDWNIKVAFNMAGKFIAARGNVDFDRHYPKQELAKFKSGYRRMKTVTPNERIGDITASKLSINSKNKEFINKYGVAVAMNNGAAYILPFTDKKIRLCCQRLRRDLLSNIKSIDHRGYVLLSRYIMLIRMVDVMALNNTSNSDKYDYLNKQLDTVFLNTQKQK